MSVRVLGMAMRPTACTTLQNGIESPATATPDLAGIGTADSRLPELVDTAWEQR